LKPAEVTLRSGMDRRENNAGDKSIWGIIHVYIEMSQ
jgi:hypothetical protein